MCIVPLATRSNYGLGDRSIALVAGPFGSCSEGDRQVEDSPFRISSGPYQKRPSIYRIDACRFLVVAPVLDTSTVPVSYTEAPLPLLFKSRSIVSSIASRLQLVRGDARADWPSDDKEASYKRKATCSGGPTLFS